MKKITLLFGAVAALFLTSCGLNATEEKLVGSYTTTVSTNSEPEEEVQSVVNIENALNYNKDLTYSQVSVITTSIAYPSGDTTNVIDAQFEFEVSGTWSATDSVIVHITDLSNVKFKEVKAEAAFEDELSSVMIESLTEGAKKMAGENGADGKLKTTSKIIQISTDNLIVEDEGGSKTRYDYVRVK